MANTIQIKRGLEANRSSVTPAAGELLYTTDEKLVYIGDGTTAGGNPVAPAGGATIEATASGALANGDVVVVNSDGTVSAVFESALAIGTPVVYQSAGVQYRGITYDSANGKVVVVWRDASSSVGYAAVGTVSGTSISFGTPVQFSSGSIAFPSITYDSVNEKVVIAFLDYGNSQSSAIVGTVSGTSISFGSPAAFLGSTGAWDNACTYDSVNEKVVVIFRDTNNSSYGTAAVGTVSGTSISFGSPVVFQSAATTYPDVAFHAAEGKVVVAYVESGDGWAIVGTVSGTSISFGTRSNFETSATTYTRVAYHPVEEKVVIGWHASYGYAVVGTVSGTSITYGTEQRTATTIGGWISLVYDSAASKIIYAYRATSPFQGRVLPLTVTGTDVSFGSYAEFESGGTEEIATAYDSVNQKVVISYIDQGNSNYGTAVVYQAYQANMTDTNFIGISDGAYADASTATVQIVGAVDDAQTGLTAGQAYYVQTDGTLSTTPDTPSVFAGTAISATQLIVKG